MSLTTEQQAVVAFIRNTGKEKQTVLINAVAGSGKTYLLTQIVKQIPHVRGIYLAYNKSVATEASTKFPSSIACSTTHSLAYRAVVSALSLKVGNFTYRNIKEPIKYEDKQDIVDTVREFCLSAATSFEAFAKQIGLTTKMSDICIKYLSLMYEGTIECSHDFYLKVYHLSLLSGDITYDEQDFLLIDECGDLNPVTIEIFKLLPARIKIAVGDDCQNVYGFNHTVNAFDILKDSATLFNLTKSFRVADTIAVKLEKFCKNYIDDDMVFTGVKVTDPTVVTTAYISRTNAGMITTMIELVQQKRAFSTVRSVADIFKLPLSLAFAKYEGSISDPAYKYLQGDIDDWYESPELQVNYKSPLLYIASLYTLDVSLSAAVSLILRNGKQDIINAYNFVKANQGKDKTVWLGTAHSFKGLEYDKIIINDDLNKSTLKAIGLADSDMSDEDKLQERNLYYVACSRAKKELYNATILEM